MDRSCLVAPPDLTRPLAYQVVEIADEPVSAGCARPNAVDSRAPEDIAQASRQPWAPVGCLVVLVADEKGPGQRRSPSPRRHAPRRPAARHSLLWDWAAVGIGG